MIKTVIIIIFMIALFSCGNTAKKEAQNSELKPTYDLKTIECMANACSTNDECKCTGADVCIPEEAGMDSAIGENTNFCTISNCDPASSASCPEGYFCHEIKMGQSLIKYAKTLCIKKEITNLPADTDVMSDSDMDTELTPDSKPDTDIDETAGFPACYGSKCAKTSDCCDGTACLPKGTSSPDITVTEICVVKGCKTEDSSTCPAGYKCISSPMTTYCVK